MGRRSGCLTDYLLAPESRLDWAECADMTLLRGSGVPHLWKGTRSCTCTAPCWKDLPGAKWKLPATWDQPAAEQPLLPELFLICRPFDSHQSHAKLDVAANSWLRAQVVCLSASSISGHECTRTLLTARVPHRWQPSPLLRQQLLHEALLGALRDLLRVCEAPPPPPVRRPHLPQQH